ncbi:MAG: transposase family protein, partial [Burkholderia sp.]
MPSIMDAFADLRDPRCRQCAYPLNEILLTARAVRCVVWWEDWETMVLWGRTQLAWLRRHLPYANGIPCEDTFRRVFAGLSLLAFERCFITGLAACVRASRACMWRSTARHCAATPAVGVMRCT